ncbi:MAG TPA: hypothetical protein RMH99_12905 [Sandaracinaceae bacterium LLY-WYZ-13_1]|nr:hypothetical protein [Sandaracinaceae bacterium LLY-WYZ-13_1]
MRHLVTCVLLLGCGGAPPQPPSPSPGEARDSADASESPDEPEGREAGPCRYEALEPGLGILADHAWTCPTRVAGLYARAPSGAAWVTLQPWDGVSTAGPVALWSIGPGAPVRVAVGDEPSPVAALAATDEGPELLLDTDGGLDRLRRVDGRWVRDRVAPPLGEHVLLAFVPGDEPRAIAHPDATGPGRARLLTGRGDAWLAAEERGAGSSGAGSSGAYRRYDGAMTPRGPLRTVALPEDRSPSAPDARLGTVGAVRLVFEDVRWPAYPFVAWSDAAGAPALGWQSRGEEAGVAVPAGDGRFVRWRVAPRGCAPRVPAHVPDPPEARTYVTCRMGGPSGLAVARDGSVWVALDLVEHTRRVIEHLRTVRGCDRCPPQMDEEVLHDGRVRRRWIARVTRRELAFVASVPPTGGSVTARLDAIRGVRLWLPSERGARLLEVDPAARFEVPELVVERVGEVTPGS